MGRIIQVRCQKTGRINNENLCTETKVDSEGKPASSAERRLSPYAQNLHSILHLQRTIGNQAVQRMLQADAKELEAGSASSGPTGFVHDFSRIPLHANSRVDIQPKLEVNAPGDIYEQEADRTADKVMGIPETELSGTGQEQVQRKRDRGRSDADEIIAPSVHYELTRSTGEPLDSESRDFFEARFGHDFSQVRVHTDAKAAKSARALYAKAYTTGHNVVFGARQYAPHTTEGRRLLAHELTHVIQQEQRISPADAHARINPGTPRLWQPIRAPLLRVMAQPTFRAGLPNALIQRYSTEDCNEKDKKKIEKSHNHAKSMIKRAIGRLEADPITKETKKHFANHFGAYADWRRSIVLNKLKVVQKELDKSKMTYECESDSDCSAKTYWVFGDIHVCTPWLHSEILNERAETFIHEILHWKLGILDLGSYHKNNKDNKTSWPVAVNTADAYSELAQDLYEQP